MVIYFLYLFILPVGQAIHRRLMASLKKTTNMLDRCCHMYNELSDLPVKILPAKLTVKMMKDSTTWQHLVTEEPATPMHEEIMILHQKVLRAGEEIIMCKQDISTISESLNAHISFLENRALICADTAYNLGLLTLFEDRLRGLKREKCLLLEQCEKNNLHL